MNFISIKNMNRKFDNFLFSGKGYPKLFYLQGRAPNFFYCKRFAQSAGPGSEKGPLLELIFAWLRKGSTFGAHFRTREVRLCHFLLICRSSGALWELWGPTFDHKNGLDHQRCPKRHFPKYIFTFLVTFGNRFSSIFRFLGLCF